MQPQRWVSNGRTGKRPPEPWDPSYIAAVAFGKRQNLRHLVFGYALPVGVEPDPITKVYYGGTCSTTLLALHLTDVRTTVMSFAKVPRLITYEPLSLPDKDRTVRVPTYFFPSGSKGQVWSVLPPSAGRNDAFVVAACLEYSLMYSLVCMTRRNGRGSCSATSS